MIAELPDGRELEFPDGTDPAVVQATVKKVLGVSQQPKPEAPSYPAVIGNALNKGIAGAVDTVGNLGHNIVNLGKAAYGAGAYALGRKDMGDNVEMLETPDLARKGMEKLNLIRPEAEPQTTGQRVVDSAVQTGAGMATMPARGIPEAIRNVATGLFSGMDSQAVREAGGSNELSTAVGMVTPGSAAAMARTGKQKVAAAMERRATNAVRDESLARGQAEGYVVPPSHVNPSIMNKAMESLAGKADVKQDMSIRNQSITNQLANRALGLPEDTAITPELLGNVRYKAAKPYRDVAEIVELPGMGIKQPVDALRELKDARFNAQTLYKDRANPDSLRKAESEAARAEELEGALERSAERAGKPELLDDFRNGRTQIAKTYDIENNLNLGDANVDALGLRNALDKGRPLSGELNTIARFASSFPQVSREAAKVPSPGVSKLNAFLSGVGGIGGYAAFGPYGIPLAALPFASGAARSAVASPFYQRHFAQPNYGQGKYMNMIPEATTQEAVAQAALIGAMQERKKRKE